MNVIKLPLQQPPAVLHTLSFHQAKKEMFVSGEA